MEEQRYQNAQKIHKEMDELAKAIEMLQKDLPARELKLDGITLPLNKTEIDTFRKMHWNRLELDGIN